MNEKLILIGIDGMDPVIAESMMASGELPNFERLSNRGHYNRLDTVVPPQSPVVWASIATGQNPGGHGVFDFIHRKPSNYLPTLSLFQTDRGRHLNPVRSTTFWERIASRGISASLLKWPMGFPPRAFGGRLLAGLGVPDIRGMLGVYTVFTSAPQDLPHDAKGRIMPIVSRGGRIATEIFGPFTASITGRKEVAKPLEILIEGDLVRCRTGKQIFTLRKGEWSGWLALPFDIGFFRNVTGLCRFYLKSLKPEFVLYMTPVNVDYESTEFPIATPAGYAAELCRETGPYATLGMAEDTNALNDGVLDEDEFLFLSSCIMDERERLFFNELSRFKEGLLSCVFDTTDRVQHMFWRMRDSSHPMHDAEQANRYCDVIEGLYRRMDRVVGTVQERCPDARLVICSDHGFSTFRRTVHINTWLEKNGYLSLKPGKPSCEGLFENVDWSGTRAYAVGLTSLYLNVVDREKHGIVRWDERADLKREITEKLAAFSDVGQPVVHKVYDTQSIYSGAQQPEGPDLVIGFKSGYRGSWQTAVGGVPDGEIVEDNRKKWSGDHCCDAGLVPGVFFCSKGEDSGISSVLEISDLIGQHFGSK
jgi:predicted AlkP superfamily phosphohydrolase/phosphomutase